MASHSLISGSMNGSRALGSPPKLYFVCPVTSAISFSFVGCREVGVSPPCHAPSTPFADVGLATWCSTRHPYPEIYEVDLGHPYTLWPKRLLKRSGRDESHIRKSHSDILRGNSRPGPVNQEAAATLALRPHRPTFRPSFAKVSVRLYSLGAKDSLKPRPFTRKSPSS